MPVPLAVKNCIQLASCDANQLLPMNPELPADLFTSCLTTPIKVALRWSVFLKALLEVTFLIYAMLKLC